MRELTQLLDTPTLAEKLSVKPNTLEKWRLTGEGPAFIRMGKRVVYDPRDVEAWLAERRRNSTSG